MNYPAIDLDLDTLSGMKPLRRVVFSLGGNEGDVLETLQKAVDAIASTPDVIVTDVSSVYRTTPVGRTGQADFLPMEMLCAWLRLKLGVPVETEFVPDAQAVTGVYLTREDGVISLERPYEDQALISLPGQTPQEVSVPMRTIEDCLTEELRRIDPDEIYAEVINEGWDLIRH